MPPATPTYLALADLLERDVSGLAPGDRVPSEHELVARHEVSRLTARAAVQELERRHLVRRVRGSGTFVARRLDYRITADDPPSWSDTVRRAGGDPMRRVLGLGRVAAPSHVRDALGLRARQRVVAVTRLGTVDGVVADASTSWVPDDLVEHIDSFLHDGASLYDALVARGTTPKRRWTTAELAPVPAATAVHLELEGRPLVWRIMSCNEDAATGRPVELGEGWMRPDVYRITLELGSRP
ncbi:MAG: GntR family transcriptional regulator [Chloroflexi bacterium]|nr:GntR family transcriptional regulator [Chloroflexota bacterium]